MAIEWVHASRDLKESLLPEARHHMSISIGTCARRCLRPGLQTLISRCSHGSLLEAEHSLALLPIQALIDSCCLILLRTARHHSLLESLLAFDIVMDQTTVVTQLGVTLAIVGFLRLLAHRLIEENDVFHLIMIERLVCSAHLPCEFLRIEIAFDQFLETVRALRPKLLEDGFGLSIRIRIIKGLFDANVFLHVLIVLTHDLIHLLNVVRVVLSGSIENEIGK